MLPNREMHRSERTFQHVSGETNMILNPGESYIVAPRHPSAVFVIDSVRLALIGKGILSSVDGWTGASGRLELKQIQLDRYGMAFDVNASEEWLIENAFDWRAGTYLRTTTEVAPTNNGYESPNRGSLVLEMTPTSIASGLIDGTWISPWHEFEVDGGEVEFIAWDAIDAMDRNAQPLRKFKVEVRHRVGGNVGPWADATLVLPNQPDPFIQNGGVPRVPATGQVAVVDGQEVQIRVTLIATTSAGSVPVRWDDLAAVLPSMKSVKLYRRLARPRYSWESVGDLCMDADLPLQSFERIVPVGIFSWADILYADLLLDVRLNGATNERLELSYSGPLGQLVSISATVSGTVEYEREAS